MGQSFLVHMSVLHVSAGTLKNSSIPPGHQRWGHAFAEIIAASHPAPLQALRWTASPCAPSSPQHPPPLTHWLIQGLTFHISAFTTAQQEGAALCAATEAEVCAACLSQ